MIKNILESQVKKYVWENYPEYKDKELIIEWPESNEHREIVVHIRINANDEPLIITTKIP